MGSTNKTPLGLNQWVGVDKPKMEDFNADNQIINAALANKVNGKITIYTALQELGLTPGTETIESICISMSIPSELQLAVYSQYNLSQYPGALNGMLRVNKASADRITLSYSIASVSVVGFYAGTYYNNTFSGWKPLPIEDNIPWTLIEPLNGATSTNAAYCKKGGVVYLRGEFLGVSDGKVVGRLPNGCRPSNLGRLYLVPANNTQIYPQLVVVQTNGDIGIIKTSGSSSITLDSISFAI